jgi:hypothetical protein
VSENVSLKRIDQIDMSTLFLSLASLICIPLDSTVIPITQIKDKTIWALEPKRRPSK